MKFTFALFILAFSLPSFAYKTVKGSTNHWYVVCDNGNSGGNFMSQQEADSKGSSMCRGRDNLRAAPMEAVGVGSDRGSRGQVRINNQ